MKKSWLGLIALFVAIVAVAAGVAAQAATPSTLSGTVRVGSWESGPAIGYWSTAISNFQQLNPGVTIDMELPPSADYGTKLLAEFASNSAPDIFLTGDGNTAQFASLGVTQDLDPYIDGPNGFDRSLLYPGVAAFGQVNGATYYLTKDYSPLMVYYNADEFAAAGVDVPTNNWTWDDLLKAAQLLTIDSNGNNSTSANFDPTNIKQWGINMSGDWERGLMPVVLEGGGSFIAPDGSKTTGYLNSAATVSALQWYVDLYNKYHVAPTKNDQAAFNNADMFQSGQVAMAWNGVWPLGGYRAGDSALPFKFGTVQLPVGPAGRANVLCWSGLALYSGSQNKDAAWAFLKYMAAGDGNNQLASYALSDVVPVVTAQGLPTDQYEGSVIADLANAKPIPEQLNPFWSQCDKFGAELDTVLYGDVTVQDAMDKAASEDDACLSQMMAAATPAAS